MIRPAAPGDVEDLLGLVVDLAVYEREPDAVTMTAPMLRAALFEGRTAYCEVAEVDGEVVGFALWFPTFSTWTGVSGIHLEDLYVRPEHRGGGHGRALLTHLAGICAVRGWARLEWNVLTWNEPAIGFYRSLGALPQEEWRTFRLDGDALAALGG